MRTIHIGLPNDGLASVSITDEGARALFAAGLIYECGDEPGNHDLHIAPDLPRVTLAMVETLLVSIAQAQPGTGAAAGSQAGLPVAGYKPTQPQWAIDIVNENKVIEERCLRQIEKHSLPDSQIAEGVDQRHVAIARTKIQEAFMWLNRGVFQPGRVKLPEDETSGFTF